MKRQWPFAFVCCAVILASAVSGAAGGYEQLANQADFGFLIPEPGALALLALGVAVLAFFWRRRK